MKGSVLDRDRPRRSPSSPSSRATSRRTSPCIGGGIVGITTALLLTRGRRPRRAAGGRPAHPRRDRPHHGEGDLAARARLRPAPLAVRHRGRADLRGRQRGRAGVDRRPRAARRHRLRLPASRRLRLRDGVARALERRVGGCDRDRAGLPARWTTIAAALLRCRARCASTTRPSSTCASTCVALGEALVGERLPHLRALARGRGRQPRGAGGGQDAGRPRARRRRGRDPLPVPRPLARLRARPPGALLRAALPDRRQAAGGHAHQRRPADALGARGAASAARSCCWSAARAIAPAPAVTRRSATSASRRSRASTGTCESVEYRWSAQDNTTVDTLPYVGRLTPRDSASSMATGFAKWGMTGGTSAALLLSDLIWSAARTRGHRCSTPTG